MSAVAADIIKSINEEIIVPAGSTKDTIAAVYHRLDGDEDSLVSDGLIDALEADEEAQRLEITLLNLDARRVQERLKDKEEEYKVSRAVAEAEARAAAIKAQLKKAKTSTPSVTSTIDYDDQPLDLSNETDRPDGKPDSSVTGVSGQTTIQGHDALTSSSCGAAARAPAEINKGAAPRTIEPRVGQGWGCAPGCAQTIHDEPSSGVSIMDSPDGRRVTKLIGPEGEANAGEPQDESVDAGPPREPASYKVLTTGPMTPRPTLPLACSPGPSRRPIESRHPSPYDRPTTPHDSSPASTWPTMSVQDAVTRITRQEEEMRICKEEEVRKEQERLQRAAQELEVNRRINEASRILERGAEQVLVREQTLQQAAERIAEGASAHRTALETSILEERQHLRMQADEHQISVNAHLTASQQEVARLAETRINEECRKMREDSHRALAQELSVRDARERALKAETNQLREALEESRKQQQKNASGQTKIDADAEPKTEF